MSYELSYEINTVHHNIYPMFFQRYSPGFHWISFAREKALSAASEDVTNLFISAATNYHFMQ